MKASAGFRVRGAGKGCGRGDWTGLTHQRPKTPTACGKKVSCLTVVLQPRQFETDFLYFCTVVLPQGRAAVFIEKKASFRLSVSVNLDNSRMLVRISEIKLAYECFCQIRIGGACSSVSY